MGDFAPKKVDKLTDEQRRLVEDNHNLIYKVLYDKHLDIDEWYDIAAIALCNAAKLYDANRDIQFSTYAYISIFNGICREYALSLANRKIPKDKIYSLDYEFGDGNETYTIKDYYVDGYSFENDVVTKERFLSGLKQMPSQRDREIIVLISEGYTYEKVGKIYNISRERVRQIIQRYACYINHKIKKNKGYNRSVA